MVYPLTVFLTSFKSLTTHSFLSLSLSKVKELPKNFTVIIKQNDLTRTLLNTVDVTRANKLRQYLNKLYWFVFYSEI